MSASQQVRQVIYAGLLAVAALACTPKPPPSEEEHSDEPIVDTDAESPPETDTPPVGPLPTLGESCPDGQCEAGYLCIPLVGDAGAAGVQVCLADEGTACASNGDCATPRGLTCAPTAPDADTRACRSPGLHAAPCDAGDAADCEAGICGPGTNLCQGEVGDPCLIKEDCLVYQSGAVVCRLSDAGDSRLCSLPGPACSYCDDGGDCETGVCTDHVCTAPTGSACRSDACCATGEQCFDARGAGLECHPPQTDPLTRCQEDPDCGEGMICVEGECRGTANFECDGSADCDGLMCIRGQCLPPSDIGGACADASGLGHDEFCAAGLLCDRSTGPDANTCILPATKGDNEPCGSDLECGAYSEDASALLVCHEQLRECVLPGPPIFKVLVSERYEVCGTDGGSTRCGTDRRPLYDQPFNEFCYPTEELPPAYSTYKTWRYVDALTHLTAGSDDATVAVTETDVPCIDTDVDTDPPTVAPGTCQGGSFALNEPEGADCITVNAYGDRDVIGANPMSRDTFYLNTVYYNPTLVHVSRSDFSFAPGDTCDADESATDGRICVSDDGQLALTKEIAPGWEGAGFIELRSFQPGNDYGSFVGAVMSVQDVKGANLSTGEDPALQQRSYMLYVLAARDMCGGELHTNATLVTWRQGLRRVLFSQAVMTNQVIGQQTVGVQGATDRAGSTPITCPDPEKCMSFVGVISSSVNGGSWLTDDYWKVCSTFATDAGLSCNACVSEDDPGCAGQAQDMGQKVQEQISGAAGEAAEHFCGKVDVLGKIPGVDVCNWAGKAASFIVDKIIGLFLGSTCGSGVDKDAGWQVGKDISPGQILFSANAITGESSDNPEARITTQNLVLFFPE